MRRRLAALVALFAVAVSFVVHAEVTRPLTAEESTAVTAYITAREQAETEKFAVPSSTEEGIQNMLRGYRNPCVICREYERHKINIPNWHPGAGTQRWIERPKFPGWDDNDNYTWHADGKSYQSQLFCKKCGKFVNPAGNSCAKEHPLPVIDQWKFTVELIAKDYNKPTEAKAHLKNALDHGEITEAQWDECMAVIDNIVAEAAATPPAK